MSATSNVSQVSAEINRLISDAEQKFSRLNAIQLNWKKNPSSWSIAQCFEHVLITNQKYLDTFELLLKGKFKSTFWQTLSPFTNSIGKNMIKTLGVNVTKKFQAPKLFLPSKKMIRPEIVREFINQQLNFARLVEALSVEKFNKTVISSPVAGLITLRLKDVIRLMIIHAERHLAQAGNVMHDGEFPSA